MMSADPNFNRICNAIFELRRSIRMADMDISGINITLKRERDMMTLLSMADRDVQAQHGAAGWGSKDRTISVELLGATLSVKAENLPPPKRDGNVYAEFYSLPPLTPKGET